MEYGPVRNARLRHGFGAVPSETAQGFERSCDTSGAVRKPLVAFCYSGARPSRPSEQLLVVSERPHTAKTCVHKI